MGNTRLLWLSWAVIVLPTVMLATLAARTVKTRETLLRQEYTERAGEVLTLITDRVRAMLDDETRTIADDMGRAIDADGTYAYLSRAAERVAETHTAVTTVVVFMSPWGFVYPAAYNQADATTDPEPGLKEVFNRAVAEGRPTARSSVGIRHAQSVYTLAAVPGRRDLYAGFQIDENAVAVMADALLTTLRDRHYRTRIDRHPHAADPTYQPDHGLVTVTDSFDTSRVATVTPGTTTIWQSLADGTTLASMNLHPPLEHIQVSISHPVVAGATSIRLWNIVFQAGIVLLGIIICGGTAIVLRSAVGLAYESRRRSELVAGMSHDLKTPVTAMRMMADGLSSGHITDPAKQRRFLDTITKECDRLGDIVDRILFFLRHDSETVRFTAEPIDVSTLLDHCATMFRDRLGERIELDVHTTAPLPPVRGDADALAKVIGNLLDNAFKYGVTDDDRFIGLAATHTRYRSRPAVEIRVSDHGPGIPLSEQRRVFERFYRIPSPAQSHIGGIGLGLALCNEIIHAHRGRITIDSRPGRGCIFILTLPTVRNTNQE